MEQVVWGLHTKIRSLGKLHVVYRSVRNFPCLRCLVTYSSFLDTPDGRGLVAIGCAEGVWIGFRHDSRCEYSPELSSLVTDEIYIAMRRVLHLKMVTQCAMLEDFGIFLVLADKVCRYQ